jgi:hypothetical protein
LFLVVQEFGGVLKDLVVFKKLLFLKSPIASSLFSKFWQEVLLDFEDYGPLRGGVALALAPLAVRSPPAVHLQGEDISSIHFVILSYHHVVDDDYDDTCEAHVHFLIGKDPPPSKVRKTALVPPPPDQPLPPTAYKRTSSHHHEPSLSFINPHTQQLLQSLLSPQINHNNTQSNINLHSYQSYTQAFKAKLQLICRLLNPNTSPYLPPSIFPIIFIILTFILL